MAVIKIVPMPGAVGDKGDEGAPGAQGPQGETGLQGPAGADALWHYNGPWQLNATYAEGDVVTHEGQTYYATGITTLATTPDIDSNFDLIAAKGLDSVLPTSGTWDTKVAETSGIIGGVYASEDIELGRYYTIGDLVFIEVHFAIAQATEWGGFGDFSGELPFPVAPSWQTGFSVNSSRNYLQGRYFAKGDVEPLGFPYQENEIGNIDMIAVLYNSEVDQKPMFSLYVTDKDSLNTTSESIRPITPEWPINLNVANSLNNPSMSFTFSGVYRRA